MLLTNCAFNFLRGGSTLLVHFGGELLCLQLFDVLVYEDAGTNTTEMASTGSLLDTVECIIICKIQAGLLLLATRPLIITNY